MGKNAIEVVPKSHFIVRYLRHKELPWEEIELESRKDVRAIENRYIKTGELVFYDPELGEVKTVKPIAVMVMQQELLMYKRTEE